MFPFLFIWQREKKELTNYHLESELFLKRNIDDDDNNDAKPADQHQHQRRQHKLENVVKSTSITGQNI